MVSVAAALSAVMNNVAALALLMPVDLEAAAKAKRSPALTLMPLSFATILGGLVTLIGTPPNVVIDAYTLSLGPGAWRATLREASLRWPAIRSIAPELARPRLTIRTSAMITVAG
jgi:hypothetical protein